MRCTGIKTYGIDKLISGYRDFQNDEEYIKYGKKLSQFFENTEIILHLSDVKGIELLILRRFCSSLVIADNDGSSLDFVAPINANILRARVAKTEDEIIVANELSSLGSKILTNYSVLKKKVSSLKEGPSHWMASQCCDCGSYRFKVVARFEGVNITSLLSAFPETVLRIDNDAKFGHIEYYDVNSKEMELLIVKKFITNFFDYMEEMLGQVDTLTDVQFNRHYLKTLELNDCVLSHIRTPYGTIDWSEMDSSSTLVKTLSNINNEAKSSGYYFDTLKDFTYHFMVRSTMDSLITMSAYSNLVYYYEDLKLLNGQKSITNVDLTGELEDLFLSNINLLDEYRLDVVKKLKKEEKEKLKIHYNRVETYEFIPRGAFISFAIHGTERDIFQFIAEIETKNIHIKELDKIISSMKQSIQLIHAVMKKIDS